MTGGVNTAVGLAVIFGLKWFLDVGDILANVSGYAVGVCVSFMLNSKWTFRYEGAFPPAFVKFVLVLLVAYLANLATVLWFIQVAKVDSYLAQAAGVPVFTAISFLGSRQLAFSRHLRND